MAPTENKARTETKARVGLSARGLLPGVGLAVVVVATVVAVALGANTVLLFAGAALPWFLIASRRVGPAIAVGATVIVTLSLLLFTTMATAALSAPMLLVVMVLWGVLGLAGAVVSVLADEPLWMPSKRAAAVGGASLLGGAVWIGALLVAAQDKSSGALGWVMTGDSPNNVLFARELIYRGGIAVGTGENPVPLPAATMGIAMAAGRGGVAPADLLEHDLVAFVVVWALVIAALGFFAGAVAASIAAAGGAGTVVSSIVAGLASLLPLSWFFGTYPIEYGFYNTHLAAVVVLASLLVYLHSSRSPWASVALLLLACTLLLAVWSPLVLLGAGLALAVVFGHWRRLMALRGIRLALMVAAVVQLLGYALAIAVPSLITLQSFLSASGAVRVFPAWMVMGAVVAVLTLLYLSVRFLPTAVSTGVSLLAVFGGLGLAALLFLSRVAGGWTYYPLKFAWLVAVVMFVVAVGLVPALIVRALPGRTRLAGVAAVAAVAVGVSGFLVVAPDPDELGFTRTTIVDWVARDLPVGTRLGGDVAQDILALSDPATPTFLFRSGDPAEEKINFWLLEMRADSMTKRNDLRLYSYKIYEDTTEDLCAVVKAIGGDVAVITEDESLVTAVEGCTDFNGHIVVQEAPAR